MRALNIDLDTMGRTIILDAGIHLTVIFLMDYQSGMFAGHSSLTKNDISIVIAPDGV